MSCPPKVDSSCAHDAGAAAQPGFGGRVGSGVWETVIPIKVQGLRCGSQKSEAIDSKKVKGKGKAVYRC